jgi:hypothetical protein
VTVPASWRAVTETGQQRRTRFERDALKLFARPAKAILARALPATYRLIQDGGAYPIPIDQASATRVTPDARVGFAVLGSAPGPLGGG